MRCLSLLLGAALLAGCAAAPQPTRSARAEQRFQELLAGKAAGQPVSCLPSYRAGDMVVIDDDTILFRDGSRRVYVNRPAGGCSHLGAGGYALVTRNSGTGLCRGDIAHVTDLHTGMTVGSCSLGDFVPYSKPRV